MIPAETAILLLMANGRIRDYYRDYTGFVVYSPKLGQLYIKDEPVAEDFDFSPKKS